jgi:hypothetical protein
MLAHFYHNEEERWYGLLQGSVPFRLVAPPLQAKNGGAISGTGCMVSQPLAARGNRSYLEFWVVCIGACLCLRKEES